MDANKDNLIKACREMREQHNLSWRHKAALAWIIGILMATSGCAPYAEIKVGQMYHDYVDPVDLAHISVGLERRWGERVVGHCEWTHVSNPSIGRPFNDHEEIMAYEFPNCGIRVGGAR